MTHRTLTGAAEVAQPVELRTRPLRDLDDGGAKANGQPFARGAAFPPPEPAEPELPYVFPDGREVWLFELAWEVCNQIGGIYQVIRSKAPAMRRKWGDRYVLVGPDNGGSAQVEFEEEPAPEPLATVIEVLDATGVQARYGRWLIGGRPQVILLTNRASQGDLNQMKYFLWADHGLEIPPHDQLVDDVVRFAHAARMLLRALVQHRPDMPIIAHFHEWMGGLAIPLLRRDQLPLATVFTTHATILGRYLAPNLDRFYDALPHLDPAAEAERYQVKHLHGIERACAHGAHVLTTVSEVTGEECRHLLGRAPDVILPNGLNIDKFDAKHHLQSKHAEHKEQVHRFVRSHFFPYYAFDLEKTVYFFTSGRYEPHNKGFDLCLEAMARLNAEIKAAGLDITVVFFIVTQRPGVHINNQCLRSRALIRELHDTCQEIIKQVGARFFDQVTSFRNPQIGDLVDEYWMIRLKRTMQAWRRRGLPPVATHDFEDGDDDPVLRQIHDLWLDNAPEHPVKVVYHPEFITPANPLWKMEYEQFVRGCHLGVFPSAYEPWGYTPLECIASGIPAVSSDLAGFGCYVQRHYAADHDQWGAYVVRRQGRSFHESAAELTERLLWFCRQARRDRIHLRNQTAENADHFDWLHLADNYEEAHVRAAGVLLSR